MTVRLYSGNLHDGRVLASRGRLVVVTLNYRLGILGEDRGQGSGTGSRLYTDINVSSIEQVLDTSCRLHSSARVPEHQHSPPPAPTDGQLRPHGPGDEQHRPKPHLSFIFLTTKDLSRFLSKHQTSPLPTTRDLFPLVPPLPKHHRLPPLLPPPSSLLPLTQIAALKWIQQNIGQFGGDPELVTMFGYR